MFSFQTSHHRVSNWVTDVQNQQFPIYQPTMPLPTTDTENPYQRSGASGMSLQSQHNLSSAVSLQRAQRPSGARYPKEQSKLNQSVPIQPSGGQKAVIYHFPGTEMPYLIKLDDMSYRRLTLKDVKDRNPKKGPQYRYFFKTIFEGFEVFEEVHVDTAEVPMLTDKIVVECRGADC